MRRANDALRVTDELFFKGRPDLKFQVEQEVERLRLAIHLREIREKEGLSQQELAERVGTQRSVIARIENPGYDKHSMSTLRKVSGALGYVMKVTFVPAAVKAELKPAETKAVGKARAKRPAGKRPVVPAIAKASAKGGPSGSVGRGSNVRAAAAGSARAAKSKA